MKRVRVFISGTVQGVSFRAYTQRKAQELNLSGWVRNRLDGRVEAVFEGTDIAVEAMVEWCRTEGSPASDVDAVEVCNETVKNDVDGFTILKE